MIGGDDQCCRNIRVSKDRKGKGREVGHWNVFVPMVLCVLLAVDIRPLATFLFTCFGGFFFRRRS
jgi:hypothetical protein